MTADTVGGVWTYALELADALGGARRRGRRWRRWARRRAPRSARSCRAARRGVARERVRARVDGRPVGRRRRRAASGCSSSTHASAPDVVHLNGYAHGGAAVRRAGRRRRALCVAVVVAGGARRGGAGADWDRYRDARRARACARADAVVAPTRGDARRARRGTTARPAPPRRDPQRPRSGAVAPAAKEPFVLAAGRLWDEAKNLAALERVAPQAAVAGPRGRRRAGRRRGAACRGAHRSRPLGRPSRARALAAPRVDLRAARALRAVRARGRSRRRCAGCALVLGDIPSLREVWGDAARLRRRPTTPTRCAPRSTR